MTGEKNRITAISLIIFAVGAVLGLVAGNKEIREQLNQRSRQLFKNE